MFHHPLITRILAFATGLALTGSTLLAQDAAPMDTASMLEALKGIKEKQEQQEKSSRARALQDASAVAANPGRGAELYEEAYRYTHFEGATGENAQFREWKEREGSALREKEVLSAFQLYFNWLSISLRRAAGATPRELLPDILSHARGVMADEAAMDTFEENRKRQREQATAGAAGMGRRPNFNPREREKVVNDTFVKKLHDDLLGQPVSRSLYVTWLRLGRLLEEVSPARAGTGPAATAGARTSERKRDVISWEAAPGNLDGIYQRIVLPEMRAMQDPRAVEFWDYKLRRGADLATRSKLAFEMENFNQVTRPLLLWSRAMEWAEIGRPNQAAKEMFAIIKAYPSNSEAPGWVENLEQILTNSAAKP